MAVRTEHKEAPASGETSPSKVGPISLIDFDDEPAPALATATSGKTGMKHFFNKEIVLKL